MAARRLADDRGDAGMDLTALNTINCRNRVRDHVQSR
jgi:hypothetical protein